MSIAGLADGYEPVPPASGWNAWRRLLDLHALHDVSQRFVDAPGLAAACTGFLAKTQDGRPPRAELRLRGRRHLRPAEARLRRRPRREDPVPVGRLRGDARRRLGPQPRGDRGRAAGDRRRRDLRLGRARHAPPRGRPEERVHVRGALKRLRSARVFVSDLILLADAKTRPDRDRRKESVRLRGARDGRRVARRDERGRGRRGPKARARALPPGVDVAEEARAAGRPPRAGRRHARRRRRGRHPPGPQGDRRNGPRTRQPQRDRRVHRGAFGRPRPRAPPRVGRRGAAHARARTCPSTSRQSSRPRAPRRRRPPGRCPTDPWLASGGFRRYGTRARLSPTCGGSRDRAAQGWLEAAAAAASRAHELAPDFAEATAKLGELELRRGNRARARRLLDEALAHDPGPRRSARPSSPGGTPRNAASRPPAPRSRRSRRPTSSSRREKEKR